MDVSAIVRDIKTGRATLVCFPVEMSELKLALGLREEDDLEYNCRFGLSVTKRT